MTSFLLDAGRDTSRLAWSLQPRILMMLSGGLDSVGALYALLSEEEYAGYDILVHHVVNHTSDERERAELKAVERVILELEQLACENKIRAITYIGTSRWDMTNQLGGQIEWHKWVFIASQIVINVFDLALLNNIKYIAFGMNAEDPLWTKGGGQEQADALLKVVLQESSSVPTILCPMIEKTKDEIARYLPKSLGAMSWSCRQPLYQGGTPMRCGECHPCEKTKKWERIWEVERNHLRSIGRWRNL